jgi:fluoride ion exporter CrcB/FEX
MHFIVNDLRSMIDTLSNSLQTLQILASLGSFNTGICGNYSRCSGWVHDIRQLLQQLRNMSGELPLTINTSLPNQL